MGVKLVHDISDYYSTVSLNYRTSPKEIILQGI